MSTRQRKACAAQIAASRRRTVGAGSGDWARNLLAVSPHMESSVHVLWHLSRQWGINVQHVHPTLWNFGNGWGNGMIPGTVWTVWIVTGRGSKTLSATFPAWILFPVNSAKFSTIFNDHPGILVIPSTVSHCNPSDVRNIQKHTYEAYKISKVNKLKIEIVETFKKTLKKVCKLHHSS